MAVEGSVFFSWLGVEVVVVVVLVLSVGGSAGEDGVDL